MAHGVTRMQHLVPLHHQSQSILQGSNVQLPTQVQAGGNALICACLSVGILLRIVAIPRLASWHGDYSSCLSVTQLYPLQNSEWWSRLTV